jgi:hypothetical protein
MVGSCQISASEQMYHGKNSTVAIYQAEVLDQRPPIVRLTDRLDIH